MRPHGRAIISQRRPRALGVCDRCGFLWNLDRLAWQWDWQQGPRLTNLRILVCPTCYDKPQESGKTIILPPDPIPVVNARPENYAGADNPASQLGYNVSDLFAAPNLPNALGGNIGNLNFNGGVRAAFDGNATKRAALSASLPISNSGFNNWVGKNWNADPSGTSLTLHSTVPAVTHNVSSITITAPIDTPFLNSGVAAYHFDVSPDGVNWTTVLTGATVGALGETITAPTANTGNFQYHRINFNGNGFSQINIAQAVFNLSDAAPNDV